MKIPSKDSPQPKWIDIEDFEFICFNLTRKFLELNEPIPDYSTRENSLLESSLAAPRQAFEYSGAMLERQASVLFYSLIKNHPFKNGNKRIAVITLLIFLFLNNKWLEIPTITLYKIALSVAKSEASKRESVIKEIDEILKKYIVDAKN
jgi:prophage maintenance system killer protein